jgi:hypothetical protein
MMVDTGVNSMFAIFSIWATSQLKYGRISRKAFFDYFCEFKMFLNKHGLFCHYT